MTTKEVLAQLESMASPNIKKIYLKHGAQEPFYGVKVGDMKKIEKEERNNQALAEELYKTGNGDAMYLAGLIADKDQVRPELLDEWVDKANWYMISEYTVPWLAADSGYGVEKGLEWIKSDRPHVASSGWSALSSALTIGAANEEHEQEFSNLLDQIASSIHQAPNRVRYTMNNFVIACGAYLPNLTEKAKKVAQTIGQVKVDLGETACKVPAALDYIEKIEKMGRIGKTKKKARC